MKSFLVVVVITALAFACCAFADSAQLRVVNAALGVPALKISLDNGVEFTSLDAGEDGVSAYVPMPLQPTCVTVSPAKIENVVYARTCYPAPLADTDYTLLISGSMPNGSANASLEFFVYVDMRTPPTTNDDFSALFYAAAAAVDWASGHTLHVALTEQDTNTTYSRVFKSLGETWFLSAPAGDYDYVVQDCTPNSLCVWLDAGEGFDFDALHFYSIFAEADAMAPFLVISDDEKFPARAPLRFGHFNPRLPAIDVYLDSMLVFANLKYGDLAPYTLQFMVKITIDVYAAGADPTSNTSVPLLQRTVADLSAYDKDDEAFTLLAIESFNTTQVYVDDISPPSARYARVKTINTLTEDATLKFAYAGVESLGVDFEFDDLIPGEEANAFAAFYGVYDVSLVVNNRTAYTGEESIEETTAYTAFILSSPELRYVLVQDASYPPPAPTNEVRLVHALVNYPGKISLSINNTVIARNISFTGVSDYVSVTTPILDTVSVSIFSGPAAAPTRVFYSANRTDISPYANFTIAVVGRDQDTAFPPQVRVFDDDFFQNTSAARVRVVCLSLEMNFSVAIQLSKTDNVSANYLQSSDYINVPSGAVDLTAVSAVDTKKSVGAAAFKKNTVYTVFTFGESILTSKPKTKFSAKVVTDWPFPKSSRTKGLTSLELGLIIGGSVLFAVIILALVILAVRKRPDGYEQIAG